MAASNGRVVGRADQDRIADDAGERCLVGVRRSAVELGRGIELRDGSASVSVLLVDGGGQPRLIGHGRLGEHEERPLVGVAAEEVRRLGDLAGLVERPRLVGEEVAVDDGRVGPAQATTVGLRGVEERLHGNLSQARERVRPGIRGRGVRGRICEGSVFESAVRGSPHDRRASRTAELGGEAEDGRLVVGERRLMRGAAAALADRSLEERRGLGRCDVHADVERSRGLAEDGDVARVAPELRDVLLHPLQGEALVP